MRKINLSVTILFVCALVASRSSSSNGEVLMWGKCGGEGHTGETQCALGLACTRSVCSHVRPIGNVNR